MAKVILDMAMSLDGFISGMNDSDSGLHDYFFAPSAQTMQLIEESIKNTAVIIMGRGAYDLGAKSGGFKDSPYDAANIVLTREKPQILAEGAEAFIFLDKLEDAVKEARRLAGKKDIVIGGGATIAQSFLKAAYLDEILIHLVPVLIGQGKRLFDNNGDYKLEKLSVVDTPEISQLRYRVLK